MYACVAADLESNGRSGSNINSEMLQEKFDDSSQYDIKFRCLCESPLLAGPMVWCQDPQCHVWQHTGCVIIPEEPMEGVSPVPPQFYCETCRISRADPFWVTVAHPLYPVKLTASSIPIDGMNPGQNVEKLFHLTRADRDLLQKTEYDVQVWCILLNDKVPFRMHWPQHADLQVNGVAVQTINRPGSQLLGTNGRDDGPLIKACISDGVNKISFRRCDARIFCLGVRIVMRRTIQQVLDLIPMESDGERFEDALARVWRCIGGGVGTENADSDSDLEVVADLVPVNLRCPMSGSRMKIAGRFKPCVHMGCFDLETFVELNQRSKKWQCPICLKNYSLENIIIDPYFNRITAMMRYCGEDVTEIEVKPDGSWRVKNKNVQWDLAQWHFPDGTARVAADEVSLNLETLKQLKQESVSERHTGLKLGIDKNYDGFRDINKPEDACTHFPANILRQMFDNNSQNFIPMSSSATGSGREGENPSVKQEGCGHFDLSANIGIKLDSVSLNFYPTRGAAKYPSGPVGNAEIIVLSDSEEENENLIPPGTVYDTGPADASPTNFCVPHPGVSDSYSEDPGLTAEGSSCLRLFNSNGSGEFAMSPWPLPPVPQAGSGFQLFGSEVNVSNAYVQYSSVTCPSPVNGYSLAPEITMGSSIQMPDSSHYISESLINNSLPFCGHDSSLQNFLPTKPGGSSEQSDLKDQPDISNGILTEDWVSLSLGGGGCSSGGFGDSAAEIGFNSRNWFAPVEDGMESSANTASLLSSVNDDIIDWTTTTREMDDTSLFFPHPPTNWKRDYNPSYCPSPPQSVRTLFSRTTSNKDGDDKTKMIPPLGDTASLLSSVNDGMFFRTTMKRENNDISFYCPRPPTDQERDANPGHFPSLHGL